MTTSPRSLATNQISLSVKTFRGETISCRCLSAFGAAGFPRFRLRAYTDCTLSASEHKKAYYPTRRDEEAVNPDGTRLR